MLRRIESNWLRHYTTARKLEAAAANAVHRRHSPAIAFITSFCVDPNVDPTIVARGGPTRQHDTPGRVFFKLTREHGNLFGRNLLCGFVSLI